MHYGGGGGGLVGSSSIRPSAVVINHGGCLLEGSGTLLQHPADKRH